MCVTDTWTAEKHAQVARLISGVGDVFADVDIQLHTLATTPGMEWTQDDADRLDDLWRAYREACRNLDEAQRLLVGGT